MRRNHFLLLILFLAFSSFSLLEGDSTDDDTSTTGGASESLGKEIAKAKDFYSKQGAQFKFLVYAFNGDLKNRHEMDIRKIFEKNSNLIRIAGDVVFIKN